MTTADDLTLPPIPQAGASAPLEAATPLPWLKPLVAAVVLIFALLSLLEFVVAFVGRTMPALHYVAGPIAIGLIVLAWFAELGGLRWPLLVFVVAVTAPNLALAAIGHGQLNFLFLTLTVAWVAYRGNHTAGRVTLGLNLAVVGVAALVDLARGQIGLIRIPWAVGLILAWWATRALVFQQRLTAELRALLEISHNVASTLELEPLLALILDQLKTVVPYTGAGISVQDADAVRIIGYRGPGPEGMAVGTRLPVAQVGSLWQLMRQRAPVIIADVRADTPLARVSGDDWRGAGHVLWLRAVLDGRAATRQGAGCWLVVPRTQRARHLHGPSCRVGACHCPASGDCHRECATVRTGSAHRPAGGAPAAGARAT